MRPRLALRAVCIAAFAAVILGRAAVAAEPVKGDVKVVTDGGYARLIFHFEQAVDATVHLAGSILVINFKTPVDVAVDRLNAAAPDYIGVARRDPDGSAVRIALARKVQVDAIPAAERLFVDLLPDTWKGILPGLPKSVIDDLSQRAREADRLLHRQQSADAQKPPLIRVRVARQPTFTRYVFEMPDQVNVVPQRGDGSLTLDFDRRIRWDLADVEATLPPALKSVQSELRGNATRVTFTLVGAPKVHTFREDSSIVVDVASAGDAAGVRDKIATQLSAAQAAPTITPPETVPAKSDSPPAAPPSATPPAAPPPRPAAPAAKAVVPGVPAAAPAAISAAPPPLPAGDPKAPVHVGLDRSGDSIRLDFPFLGPTPAAAFRRGDTLWLVFDSAAAIDLSALSHEPAPGLRDARVERAADGAALVRIKMSRPRLVSLEPDGSAWTVSIADTMTMPPRPLAIVRTVTRDNRSGIVIPFDRPGKIHYLRDPDLGDRLVVVTALAPARGLLKEQRFVELRALPSSQGVVVKPVADDVVTNVAADKITISRPGGLSLSASLHGQQAAGIGYRVPTFDAQQWGFDRKAPFIARQSELIRLAAAAPDARRKQARFNLARFYLARGMASEAIGVLDVALAGPTGANDVTGSILKAVANVMLDRPQDALKDLSAPDIGNQQDATLWRAVAFAREGKWRSAHKDFQGLEQSLRPLPVELQRMAMNAALRAAIEVKDLAEAEQLLDEFETVGVPPDMKPSLDVLSGRVSEALGRNDDALTKYRAAADSSDRAAAAQGRLREIELLLAKNEIPHKTAVTALETLTTVWRGDDTETEGLKLLAHLYTEDGRYRDAFHIMRTALLVQPNSDLTRQIQDEAEATFENLFLGGKSDALPPVEALGLFYDYRDLTPIGRRGDEMIRRLSDRLVSVDLLDQAAELLQHQVDHRLQGAARAQVATRLAVIYLMNRKPRQALTTLRATRVADLSDQVRDERLLLEARALSDLGRHELALELIANIQGQPAMRLRSGILWAARRWREASEQIELMYGDRWRDFAPLGEAERGDILRAAVGYALADETLGLARLREKYTAKMADTPDRRAFEIVSTPIGTDSAEFQDIAKRIAGMDTLGVFLRDLSARYPNAGPLRPVTGAAAHDSGAGKPQAAADAPGRSASPPTGSIDLSRTAAATP